MKILDDFILTMLDGYFFKVNHGRFLQYWKKTTTKIIHTKTWNDLN